jgi:hypothetical protein
MMVRSAGPVFSFDDVPYASLSATFMSFTR